MIKQIIFSALILLSASEAFAQAGPTNGNSYRNYIRTNGFSYGYDHTTDNSANRAFFLIEAAADQGGSIPCLFDTTSGAGYDVGTVYTVSEGPPFQNFSSGTVKQIVNTTANTTIMNTTMMSWGHQCGALGDYHYNPNCDHNKEAVCTNIDTKEGPQGLYHEDWYPTGDSSKIRMQKTWKPTYGESHLTTSASTGPLTFETIGPNEYRVHENGIRRKPDGAPNNLGYINSWPVNSIGTTSQVFRNSPDVTYSFSTTEESYVIVSLDFPETNFDTRVYVIRDNGDNGGKGKIFGWRTDVNASNNSAVLSYHTLQTGNYFIVVEGESDVPADWGDYKMTVALPETYEPGHIVHPNLTVPAGCVLNSPVVSDIAPQTSLGTLEFQWEKKLASQSAWYDIPGATSESLPGEELGSISEPFKLRRRLKTMGGAAYTNVLSFELDDNPDYRFDGVISGKVTGRDGFGSVQGVTMLIDVIDGACGTTAETLEDGSYIADNLFYIDDDGDDVSYQVTPQFLDHQFDPPFRERTITSSTPRENVNFEDTTTVFVQGLVTQEDSLGKICPLPDVKIFPDGLVQNVFTQSDGTYSLPISTGDYDLKADFMDGAHSFTPSVIPLNVSADIEDINYESTTTHTVSGQVMACGDFSYGGVEIKLVDDYGCFEYLLDTDDRGNFSASLPARNYQLIVTNTNIGLTAGFDSQVIADYFEERDTFFADLSTADTVLNLTYLQSPLVSLRAPTDTTGLQLIANCTQDTVLAQGELTTLIFDVVEPNTGGCPLDTGIMMIIDEISGTDTTFHPISDGVAIYNVIPDTPYLFPFEPYQHLSFKAMTLDSLASEEHNIRAIVTGLTARNATFTTVSPEIPFLILRDPPGDLSYAELIDQETSETSLSFSTLIGGNVTTWAKAKVGAQFEAGFLGFSTESEAWGSVEGKLGIGASNATDEEFTISMTNETAYKTDDSGNPNLIGSGGDLFVGAALNLLYAKADVLTYDEEICQDTQIVKIIMGTESLETQFAYTDFFIRNSIMPELAFLRDNGHQDSAWVYQDQIEIWQQTLDRNDYLKSIADTIPNGQSSWSFGGGVEVSESTERSSTERSEYEFKMEINSELAVEAGFEIAGSGVSGGVQVSMRAEFGIGGSQTNLKSRKTKYLLKDDEALDGYFVRVKECPVYNTPIFEEIASKTSCPYNPGTSQRDKPILQILNPVRENVDPNTSEQFQITITNLSESDETRSYMLDVIDASNPNAAIINPPLAGTSELGPFSIPPNGQHVQNVFVSKESGSDVFSTEGLTFIAYPACESSTNYTPQTASKASVSIFYQSPCSDIQLDAPAGGWIITEADNNTMTVEMSGYDVSTLDSVRVEYALQGGTSWSTIASIDDSEMADMVNLDVSDISDGIYSIRLQLFCAGGKTLSPRESAIIDRQAPIVFGIPSPIDDDYDQSANDEISVSFEEDIACANATVLLTDMETLEEIPATIGCNSNKAQVVPDIILDTRGPAVYRVTLSGVEDSYGNVREDYNWVFIVGDYVYDPDCSPVSISNNNVDQDAISQSVYRATEITSDGTIASATKIDYKAEESVTLEAGFSVNSGGGLEASIEDCDND